MEINFHIGYCIRLQLFHYLVMLYMSDRQVSSEEINVLQEIGSYLQKADSDIEFLINIGNFSDSSDK